MLRTLWTQLTAPCGCETPSMWLHGYSTQMHANQRRISANILDHVNRAFAYRMPCGRRRCRHDGPLTMRDLITARIVTAADAAKIRDGIFA